MAKFLNTEAKKVGTAPGSLIFVGDQKIDSISIDVIHYDDNHFSHSADVGVDYLERLSFESGVTWINVIGLHDTDSIGQIGSWFGLHPLLVEDILNTEQRPKFEEIGDHIAFFSKMVRVNEAKDQLETEQVSIVLGKGFLMSFQEVKGDVFTPVRNRLEKPTTKIRARKSDYLAFALLDLLVDNYTLSIEFLGDKVELLISEMIERQHNGQLRELNNYKQEIIALRRVVRPLQEMCKQFERSDSGIVSTNTLPFIKDLEGHSVQSAEALELYKELINDEISIYHANATARLNEIIRVLTIFSVIFIPLTFLAGVYGMNFEYFPELGFKYAYPVFWGLILFTAGFMLLYFKRKKWL
ncbi:MAG: magnesium/cobalt transporter CorA [Cryomorphaceae bacterium]|nr:magnesium/cobalt transporter CorA [Flavobacteriales bacterium]